MEKTYAKTMSFKTLSAFLSLVACSACGQQAGESIRRIPPTTPALEDPSLTEFLFHLMDQAYTIASYDHSIAIEGSCQSLRYRRPCVRRGEVVRGNP